MIKKYTGIFCQFVKDFYKMNKFYVWISVTCLLILLLWSFYTMELYWMIGNYFTDEKYRSQAGYGNSVFWPLGIFPMIWDWLTNSFIHFDYTIIFGTNLAQIFVPALASVAGICFYKHFHSVFQMSLYRVRKYDIYLLKEISVYAGKMALAFFVAYLLFYVFIYNLSGGALMEYTGRELLLDILGDNFYYEHTYLYYILDGVVRFLYMPFVYAFLSCSLAVVCRSEKQVFLLSNIYYYGMTIVGFATYMSWGQASLYINPSVIMASGSYYDINTWLLLLNNFIPVLFSLGLLFAGRKTVEL